MIDLVGVMRSYCGKLETGADNRYLWCFTLYFTLCRAQLVLGWVTIFGRQTTSVFHQAT